MYIVQKILKNEIVDICKQIGFNDSKKTWIIYETSEHRMIN